MARWYLLRNGEAHGPYDEAQIRDWVRSGQVRPEERLNREGDSNWLSLDMIPEFAGQKGQEGPGAPGAVGPPPAGTPYVPPSAPGPYPAGRPGAFGWVGEAWRLVTTNLGPAMVVTLPIFLPALLIGGAVGWVVWRFISIAGVNAPPDPMAIAQALVAAPILLLVVLIAALLMAPLIMGACACFWEMVETGTLTSGRLMYGFSRFFSILGLAVIAFIANATITAITHPMPGIGQVLATILSFPLMALSSLAIFDMIARESNVIEAIVQAWQMLTREPLNLILLAFVGWVISIVGGVLCCVGLLVAFPLVQTAWGCCYRDMMGRPQPAARP